jgi:Na+-transporting NADH:ubiquinone oxidoreductase subunit C
MNKQSLVYTVIFTFFVSFIFVTVLAFANDATREQVQLNQELARQRAILNALNIDYGGPEDVQAKFDSVEIVERNGTELYQANKEDHLAVAKEFSGSGLWGTIRGILAVQEDMDRTVGIEILEHNETPGLGGRIDEPWFKQQFRDLRIVDGTIEVGPAGEGDEDKENGEIDAITGATRTSDAMRVILSRELSAFQSILGGNS